MTDTPAVAVGSTLAAQRPLLWRGWLIAILATAAFSLAPTVGKAAIDLGVNSTALLTLRLLIATALLGGTIVVTDPTRLRVDRRTLWVSVLAGLVNGVGMVTFFLALDYIDASVASMIFSMSPLVVLLLLALRGERFTYRNLIRLGLGLGGVYLLIGPGGQVQGMGVLLALGSVFTVPVQLMLIQWYLQDSDPQAVTFYMVAAMAVVSGGWWLVQGLPFHSLSLPAWLLLGVLAVVSTYLARLGMFAAIRYIGGGQFGLLAPLETMLTVMWSVLFLREWLSPIQWLGSGLILLSALLALQRLRRVRWRPA